MTVWAVVALSGVGTILLKATGPVLLGGRPLPPPLVGVVRLLAPAVLAALAATQVFGDGQRLVADARVIGFAAGAVAVVARAPLIAVIVIAAAAAAVTRAFT